jgi:uncharacterized protein (DUF1330 family)
MMVAGGRFLIRNKPAKTYEAGLNESVILIEFENVDKALAAYHTPAYKEALKALGSDNAERDMRGRELGCRSRRSCNFDKEKSSGSHGGR